MNVNAGVWIDHEQAIVVVTADGVPEMKKFTSGIKKPRGTHDSNTYTAKDNVAEDRLERKVDSQLQMPIFSPDYSLASTR